MASLVAKRPPPLDLRAPRVRWRAPTAAERQQQQQQQLARGGSGASSVDALLLREEGGLELKLPASDDGGWIHFCTQCTRPTSQRLMIITARRGGEAHTVAICRRCQGGKFKRFSPHTTYLVLPQHMMKPLPDVNAECDRRIAEYRRQQREQRAKAEEEAAAAAAADQLPRRRRKKCVIA